VPSTFNFIRRNAIALIALFLALGGTSYAAFSLPAGSVGTRALHNEAVTPAKLQHSTIGGVVRYMARINISTNAARLISARPRGIKIEQFFPTSTGYGVTLNFGQPRGCLELTSKETNGSPNDPRDYAAAGGFGQVFVSTPGTVDVALVCPS
jgi:hypothetical protein